MYLSKKYFTVLIYGLMLTSASWAESLTDIYQSALQNDPVLSAARANFKAGLETKKSPELLYYLRLPPPENIPSQRAQKLKGQAILVTPPLKARAMVYP